MIWKGSRLHGKFPDHLESFQTTWKVSRPEQPVRDPKRLLKLGLAICDAAGGGWQRETGGWEHRATVAAADQVRKASPSSFPACRWRPSPPGWKRWGRTLRRKKEASRSQRQGSQWLPMLGGKLKEDQDCHGPTGLSHLKEVSVNNSQGMLIWLIF